jgi:hypothetical protein
MGALDNDPKDGADLEVSCPAEWQGVSRLDRAITFNEYMANIFPQSHHSLTIVPGVAHQDVIFTSHSGEMLF